MRLQNASSQHAMADIKVTGTTRHQQHSKRHSLALRRSITGASLALVTAMLGSAYIISGAESIPLPLWGLAVAAAGYLVTGLRRR